MSLPPFIIISGQVLAEELFDGLLWTCIKGNPLTWSALALVRDCGKRCYNMRNSIEITSWIRNLFTRPKRGNPMSPIEQVKRKSNKLGRASEQAYSSLIEPNLKDTKEQKTVVGPLVQYLVDSGWSLDQLVFGKSEWRVPKTPSEATKREKGHSFNGYPVDIAVFDDAHTACDYRHLLFIVECKEPNQDKGVSQLEIYLSCEPYVKLGVWTNSPEPSDRGAFVHKRPDGSMMLKRSELSRIPKPGEPIKPNAERHYYADLIAPPEDVFRRTIEDLLDKVVARDPNVTRREDQLDQLCNLLLLKLESDKRAKSNKKESVTFRPMESAAKTAEHIKKFYTDFIQLYPDTFISGSDKLIKFSNDTIEYCVESLVGFNVLELGMSSVSVAFQILRSEALKQGEGQYFTPQQVIEAGVRLMEIDYDDIVLDPACGTGGFLIETIYEMQRKRPGFTPGDLSKWAQTHVFGIEKDSIGLKLTKAIMQVIGDGSAHCVRGDSVRTHDWKKYYPYLESNLFSNSRFSVVITNPPFGKDLKVSSSDARLAGLDIAKQKSGRYQDIEIGLIFLQRAYQWLRTGGRVGIVLPETYFFSSDYNYVFDWLEGKLEPIIVANVPMEAFQGFCRAKTNFYIFRKIGKG